MIVLPMEAMVKRWKLTAERTITEGLSSRVVAQISSSNIFPVSVKLDTDLSVKSRFDPL